MDKFCVRKENNGEGFCKCEFEELTFRTETERGFCVYMETNSIVDVKKVTMPCREKDVEITLVSTEDLIAEIVDMNSDPSSMCIIDDNGFKITITDQSQINYVWSAFYND